MSKFTLNSKTRFGVMHAVKNKSVRPVGQSGQYLVSGVGWGVTFWYHSKCIFLNTYTSNICNKNKPFKIKFKQKMSIFAYLRWGILIFF